MLVATVGARSIEKRTVFRIEIAFCQSRNQIDPKARTVTDINHAVSNNRIGETFDNVIPPLGITCGVFERNEIAGQSCAHLEA